MHTHTHTHDIYSNQSTWILMDSWKDNSWPQPLPAQSQVLLKLSPTTCGWVLLSKLFMLTS